MSNTTIFDLVNRVFLEYSPIYSIEQNKSTEEEKENAVRTDVEKKILNEHDKEIHEEKEDSGHETKEAKSSTDLENKEANPNEQVSFFNEAELLNRLLINLPMQQSQWNRFDIAQEVKPPVDSRLENHIFEFANKFIGADYPDIQTRQLYTGLNPSAYSNISGDFGFGEHHRTNLYLDRKPVYTAMRSEKVNIKQPDNQPVYMRMKHSK